MCDKWLGGSFVESGLKKAIVLLGVKGLGSNEYGMGQPGYCFYPTQGYHCDPYERQVVFYDVEQLAQVAQGAVDPWTVVPYAIWKPSELFIQSNVCGSTGGVAFDPQTGRVFMVERGLGGNNSAVVHLWTTS